MVRRSPFSGRSRTASRWHSETGNLYLLGRTGAGSGLDSIFPGLQLTDVRRDANGGRSRAAKVLDVACGTGNSAIPAARAGAKVTGIDIALNLLEQARPAFRLTPRLAIAYGPKIRLVPYAVH
jgi:SAM-dependent methyltransferase